MARDLDSLVRLQESLTEARAVRAALEGVPDSMRQLHEEHGTHSASIEALEQEIEEAEHLRRLEEAAAQDVKIRLDRFQGQINEVRTQREYGSLLKEIDGAKAELSGHEERALAALETIDEARAKLEEERSEFEDVDSRYAEAMAEWEKEKPSVADRLKHLEAEVSELKEKIPASTLLRFELLYDRLNGEALAPMAKVERSTRAPSVWHCSNCNYRIRPQVVVEIMRNGSLYQCESCQRFLFWTEAD